MRRIIPILSVAVLLTACKTKTAANDAKTTTEATTAKVTVFTPVKSLKNKFAKDFPGAKNVAWSKSDVRAYVDFVNNAGFQSDATYGFDGTLLENKVGMDINNLPLSIKNFLNTKYPSNEVQHAYYVRQGVVKKYILVRLKGTEDVLFDTNGNFLNYKPQ